MSGAWWFLLGRLSAPAAERTRSEHPKPDINTEIFASGLLGVLLVSLALFGLVLEVVDDSWPKPLRFAMKFIVPVALAAPVFKLGRYIRMLLRAMIAVGVVGGGLYLVLSFLWSIT